MKRLLKLILTVAVVLLIVKYCSDHLGSVISLPGGLGGNDTEETGGWFGPKEDSKDNSKTQSDKKVPDDISDLERELGIGTEGGSSTPVNIPSTTTTTASSSSPLSFKGIPITGSLSEFGNELVKAGFRKGLGNNYTGDFAGYSGCKVTPSGDNPVKEVRIDFPEIQDWDTLEKAYDSLQASLTQKYGIEPKTSKNSNLAVYDLPNGTISLDADIKSRNSGGHVILKYSNNSTVTIGTTGRNPIDDL